MVIFEMFRYNKNFQQIGIVINTLKNRFEFSNDGEYCSENIIKISIELIFVSLSIQFYRTVNCNIN